MRGSIFCALHAAASFAEFFVRGKIIAEGVRATVTNITACEPFPNHLWNVAADLSRTYPPSLVGPVLKLDPTAPAPGDELASLRVSDREPNRSRLRGQRGILLLKQSDQTEQ
jgi:hypothetical protein